MTPDESFLLTPEERKRFTRWCERNADSSRQLLQASKDTKMFVVLERKFKMEIVAFQFVADYLNSLEDQTIGG